MTNLNDLTQAELEEGLLENPERLIHMGLNMAAAGTALSELSEEAMLTAAWVVGARGMVQFGMEPDAALRLFDKAPSVRFEREDGELKLSYSFDDPEAQAAYTESVLAADAAEQADYDAACIEALEVGVELGYIDAFEAGLD